MKKSILHSEEFKTLVDKIESYKDKDSAKSAAMRELINKLAELVDELQAPKSTPTQVTKPPRAPITY